TNGLSSRIEKASYAADHVQCSPRRPSQRRTAQDELGDDPSGDGLHMMGQRDGGCPADCDRPSCDGAVEIAEGSLVPLIAGAEIEEPDPALGSMLENIELMDDPRSIRGEVDVIGRKPTGQHVIETQRQMQGNRALS